MGPTALAAGLVLLAALVVLVVVVATGLVLVVTGALANRRRGSKPLLWTGVVLLTAAAVASVSVLVMSDLRGDPSTIRFDLREPVTTASLDKKPVPGLSGSYEYFSDRFELVLPDGEEVGIDVDGFWLSSTDGIVDRIHTSDQADSRAEAVDQLETWADDLGVETPGLDPAGTGHWESRQHRSGIEVSLSLHEHDVGGARVALWITP